MELELELVCEQELERELEWELEWELGYLVPGRPGQPASHPHFCHGRELFGFHAHSSHLHPQTQRNPINPDCSLLGKKKNMSWKKSNFSKVSLNYRR